MQLLSRLESKGREETARVASCQKQALHDLRNCGRSLSLRGLAKYFPELSQHPIREVRCLSREQAGWRQQLFGRHCGARKDAPLAYRWPLLLDAQDPSLLEARVAYHLRRLRIRWRDVRASGLLPRDDLVELVQGRLTLSEEMVSDLARRLGVSPADLSRPLTEHESEGWHFYRTSARHRLHVWRRAQVSWERAGLSLRLAAAVMDLRPYQVVHALTDPEMRLVMSYEAASRLAVALGIEDGAGFFIATVERASPPEHGIEAVQPLTGEAIVDLYRSINANRKPPAHGRSGGR